VQHQQRTENVPETAEKTKMWHMLEILISPILRSEISHDEWINVVYLFCSDLLFFCFPENSQKLYKMPITPNMADISAPRINTRTLLLESAKATSIFFFLRICMEGIGKSFNSFPI